jgi:shikimate kinase
VTELKRRGVTLIGMPATGKSTVGRILAERLSYRFLDVDQWMMQSEGMPVGHIIAAKGRDYILALEERRLQEEDLRELVVSPPGSVIYTGSLQKLRAQSCVVLLDTSLEVLEERLHMDTLNERGVIGLTESGLQSLYDERMPLYQQWAELTIDHTGLSVDETVEAVLQLLPELEPLQA